VLLDDDELEHNIVQFHKFVLLQYCYAHYFQEESQGSLSHLDV